MSAKTQTLLKTATDILGSQNIVAFVGNSGSGKTVAGTLLKDAIFTYFGKQHGDEFGLNLIKGNDVLEETERYLFTEKVFPPQTDPGTQSELMFEISRKGALGKKIVIRIRDLSGEDFRKVFLGDDLSPTVRVNSILADKEKTESFGPLSFLLFAKLYVILIDCAEFEQWKTIQTRQSQMLNSILGFKTLLGETVNDKFTTPLAIILTKTDTLSNEIEGSPEEVIEKYMPQFHQTLEYVHAGKRKFFTMFIEADKSPENTQSPPSNQNEFETDVTSTQNEITELKLKVPLNYSSGEYIKFILWMIETLS